MRLIPYVEVNGVRTLSDADLLRFFDALEPETVETVFYGGKVKTGHDFVTTLKRPTNYPVFVEDEGLQGVAWLNNLRYNHATGHFCFLSRYRGELALSASQEILTYWFSFQAEDRPLLDVILGMVPEFNTRAVSFVQKLGFTLLGKIPKIERLANGEVVGLNLLFLERR